MRAGPPVLAILCALAASACAGAAGIAPPRDDAKLVEGPPISDIVTPFDKALSCLDGRIQTSITFAVGAIVDLTGKEQFTEGGAGKFITQGAGDIVQSALFKAGATVVNRRDPRVMETEIKWGIRDPRRIAPANLFVTGSINSLDFIPGAGADVQVAGGGPRYRQHRMLVGLDLSMTEANSGRIVANIPLQKQIFASEAGFALGRFLGDTLVNVDLGGREREALHFALRQMLNLATFELLTQVMAPNKFADCRGEIDRIHGFVDHSGTAELAGQVNELREEQARRSLATAARPIPSAPAGRAAAPQRAAPAVAAPQTPQQRREEDALHPEKPPMDYYWLNDDELREEAVRRRQMAQ